MALPRVLICGELEWAQDDARVMFKDIADIILLESPTRGSFLEDFKPGGKYYGVVAVYRDNSSGEYIGNFDREIIEGISKSVKWIAHNGAGYDKIDVIACKEHGIYVSNTPGAVDDATATTALYLLIACFRQFSRGERSLRALNWRPKDGPQNARDLTGHTIAILGLGGIGKRLAELVHAFPMRVIYHSRHKAADAPEWCEYFEDVYDMLAQADVLSVHVPLKPDTVNLVGEKMIRSLKRGAIIVNTARGKVIDEEAMIKALEDGHLSSVGLDVFPNEPQINPRLLEFPQLTLLPHMGTDTRDAEYKMELRALTNILDYFKKGRGSDLVPEFR
ncbi:hypothetical protein ONZ45_g8008 [Pleurotus djamor]|nr:hypothetical protein ONZ45_g8008 [Pleurotus djamor]